MNTQEFYFLLDHPELAASYLPELEEIADRYPWFILGKSLLSAGYRDLPDTDDRKRRLNRETALHALACNFRPIRSVPQQEQSGTMQIIDRFLARPPKRIVPPPRPAEGDPEAEDLAAANKACAEIASETLAEIYERQGLFDRSIDIYRKLSLKFPEKSIYFANRITQLQARITAAQPQTE